LTSKIAVATIGIDFDHCLEEGNTGLTHSSTKPMKRKRKVGSFEPVTSANIKA
jgi:hypothetical protein